MSQQKSPMKLRRIHKRTLGIVFCCVILPWILVAIPGESSGGWGTTGRSGCAYEHGWPLIHLSRTEEIVDGNWVNGKYFPGQMPPGLDLDKLARESARDYSPLTLNLRLGRQEVYSFGDHWPTVAFDGAGFWTDPFQWTRPGTGRHWKFLWLGLVCNLAILVLVVLLVGWVVERRIRMRGGLLKFSLKSFLLAIALLAFVIGWIGREYSGYLSQQQKIQSIDFEFPDFQVKENANFETRFPLIVSQLFNHGRLPFVNSQFFVALKSQNPGVLYLDLDDEMEPQKVRRIAESAEKCPLPVHLKIWIFGRNAEQSLVEFEDAKVNELLIKFSLTDWVDSFSDHEDYKGDILKDLEISGERVNITAKFPYLKRLTLHLCEELDQHAQLKSFCGLRTLQEVQLTEMSSAGVEFMLKTKEQWPRKIEFEFTEDVSDESKELLGQYFDSNYKFDSW